MAILPPHAIERALPPNENLRPYHTKFKDWIVRIAKLVFLLPVLTLSAETVTLLVDEENASTTTYITNKGSSVATVTTTGTIELDLKIDPLTRKPSEATFTGGTLFYSDAESIYTPTTPPAEENLIITNSDLEGQLATTQPNAAIDLLTGLLDNEDHTTSLNSGTLDIEFQIILFGIPSTIFSSTTDFATDAQVSQFSGQSRITSELLSSGPYLDTYQITLTATSDETPRDFRDEGLDLTIVNAGGFSASGILQTPSSSFLEWFENHIPNQDPPAILYALGFPPNQNEVPLTLSQNSATLALPPEGTRAPIEIQHSSNLETWSTIQTIPENSNTDLTFDLPIGPRSFVRLLVE